MSQSDLAALRGEPSYVWRPGQERRLQMMTEWARLDGARVLVAGCGVGTYAQQIRQRYTSAVDAFDIEPARVAAARNFIPDAIVSAGEAIPFRDNSFDTVLSHEVIEHVNDDRRSAAEMVRVLKPGGRLLLFCPNRWYPFETHGYYWRGQYRFGNTPLINYLPNGLRDRLAPHVRAYTASALRQLFADCPVDLVHHSRIYGGYDNLIQRLGKPARILRDILYRLERTPLDVWGLSHFLVVEKRRSVSAEPAK